MIRELIGRMPVFARAQNPTHRFYLYESRLLSTSDPLFGLPSGNQESLDSEWALFHGPDRLGNQPDIDLLDGLVAYW